MCFVSQIFPSYPRTSTVRSVRYPSAYYIIKTLLCTNPEEFNPKNKIYLFFRERQEDSVLPSMGNNRIRFPEFLLDLASGTSYSPLQAAFNQSQIQKDENTNFLCSHNPNSTCHSVFSSKQYKIILYNLTSICWQQGGQTKLGNTFP